MMMFQSEAVRKKNSPTQGEASLLVLSMPLPDQMTLTHTGRAVCFTQSPNVTETSSQTHSECYD